jgi:hypothetical protein
MGRHDDDVVGVRGAQGGDERVDVLRLDRGDRQLQGGRERRDGLLRALPLRRVDGGDAGVLEDGRQFLGAGLPRRRQRRVGTVVLPFGVPDDEHRLLGRGGNGCERGGDRERGDETGTGANGRGDS